MSTAAASSARTTRNAPMIRGRQGEGAAARPQSCSGRLGKLRPTVTATTALRPCPQRNPPRPSPATMADPVAEIPPAPAKDDASFWRIVAQSLKGEHYDYTSASLNRAVLLLAVP